MNSGLYETRSGQKYQLQTTQSYFTKKREKKNCFSVHMEGYQFLVHIFMATAVVRIRVLLVYRGFSHFGCFSAVVLAENDVTDIMGGVNIEPCDDMLETRSPSFSKTLARLLKSVDKLLLGPKYDFAVSSSLEEVVGGAARHVWLSSPAIEMVKHGFSSRNMQDDGGLDLVRVQESVGTLGLGQTGGTSTSRRRPVP